MRLHRKKTVTLKLNTEFDPRTDTPLAYFSVNRAFVRRTQTNSLKLYGNNFHMILLSHDGWIYPVCDARHFDTEIVEAFLHEYAPSVSITDIKPNTLRLPCAHIKDYIPL